MGHGLELGENLVPRPLRDSVRKHGSTFFPATSASASSFPRNGPRKFRVTDFLVAKEVLPAMRNKVAGSFFFSNKSSSLRGTKPTTVGGI
jgi:hypothetical protein